MFAMQLAWPFSRLEMACVHEWMMRREEYALSSDMQWWLKSAVTSSHADSGVCGGRRQARHICCLSCHSLSYCVRRRPKPFIERSSSLQMRTAEALSERRRRDRKMLDARSRRQWQEVWQCSAVVRGSAVQ